MKKNKIYIGVRCPSCNNSRAMPVKFTEYGIVECQLYYCDSDNEGCGKQFVIRGSVELNVSASKLNFK